jgi:hypothetical protein
VKKRVSDVTARVLGQCASPVATLNLAHCVFISHHGVAALAPLARSLTSLDLTGCFRVGDDGMPAVLQLTGARPRRCHALLRARASLHPTSARDQSPQPRLLARQPTVQKDGMIPSLHPMALLRLLELPHRRSALSASPYRCLGIDVDSARFLLMTNRAKV